MKQFNDLLNSVKAVQGNGSESNQPTPKEIKEQAIAEHKQGIAKALTRLLVAVLSLFGEALVVKLLAGVVVPEYPLDYWQSLCFILLVRLTLGSYKN
jgi:hypothetical protein